MAWRVTALMALALVLRVVALGHKGLWQDEVFSVLFARAANSEFWNVLRTREANMALYYLLLREWMKVFTSDAGVRALSVIPGVLSVPAMYALGARLYSRRVALWAAGLTAINTCAVVYSQEARGYSLLVLCVALSCWAFVGMVERGSAADFVLYVLFSVGAFYSHFYAAFVFFAQFCALGLLPLRLVPWKSLVPAWLLIGVAAVPGLKAAVGSQGANLWWVPRPGWLEIYRTLTFLAADSGKAVGAVLTVLLLIPICGAMGMAWRKWRRNGGSLESFRLGFAAVGLLAPMLATLLLSLWRPMFFHRFLMICLVPFLLLAAAGLAEMRNRRAMAALATGILALSGVATALSYNKVREDWRGAAGFTLRSGNAGDPVIFYLKDGAAPFAYYRERLGARMRERQIIRCETPPTAKEAEEWAKLYPRMWLVRFPSTGNMDAVTAQITGDMLAGGYKQCARGEFKGISVAGFCAREEHKTPDLSIAR